jgi:nucleoid DNA-binding protein
MAGGVLHDSVSHMNKAELTRALAATGAVAEHDAEAVLDALASVIWHQLEHAGTVDWPTVGQFSVVHAPRHRRTVVFEPASELLVAANRHAEKAIL